MSTPRWRAPHGGPLAPRLSPLAVLYPLAGIALITACLSTPATAQTIGRDGVDPVLDLNRSPRAVGSLVADDLGFEGAWLEGHFYYAARTSEHGRELWPTDATEAGTERLADFCLGTCDAHPRDLTIYDGGLFLTLENTDGVRVMRYDLVHSGLRTLFGSPFPVGGDAAARGPSTLCLGDGRFAITVDFRRDGQPLQTARAEPLGDSGWFWFFHRDNPEAIVKVLDGRSITGNLWFYFAPLTTLQTRVGVYDTVRDATVAYTLYARNDRRPCSLITQLKP